MRAVALEDHPKIGVIKSHIYDITTISDSVVSVETKLGTAFVFSKDFKIIDNDRKTTSRNSFITGLFKWVKNSKR